MAVFGKLPAGIVLTSGESVVSTGEYSFTLPWIFLKTKVVLTNRRIAGESPNLLLGLIPVGSNKANYPLRNIASTAAHTRIKVLRLIIGALLGLLGLALLGQSAVFFIVALLGALLIITSFQAAFTFSNNAGQSEILPILVWERGKAQAFINQVNTTLAELQ